MLEDELYKAAKLDSDDDVKSKGKNPMVEDEGEDEDKAGPELPPDFGADDVPDDEEGRFFGGGMEQKTAQAMEYIDQQDGGEVAVCALRPTGPALLTGLAGEIRFGLGATVCSQLREEDI